MLNEYKVFLCPKTGGKNFNFLPGFQVLLMVGLPGSGKSHWARTHMKQHPDKQYRLLGTEELLTCMIVSRTTRLYSGVA